jgi:hypothetical protein
MGTTSWKCGGSGSASYDNNLYAVLESSPFTLPADARLTFWHWMDAEISGSYPGYCYDGGLLELSIDGGAWEQIAPEGGYPYLLRPGTNPLPEDTPLFSGTHDWQQESFDLAAYSGSARIRFVFVSDAAVTKEGWYVDDVQLFLEFSAVGDRAPLSLLRLHRPYPNPVAGHTTLLLDLPRAERTKLCLHDASGRLIRTLVDGHLPAGQTPLVWDGCDETGSRAAAGAYWARLRAGGQQRALRLILVR